MLLMKSICTPVVSSFLKIITNKISNFVVLFPMQYKNLFDNNLKFTSLWYVKRVKKNYKKTFLTNYKL